MFDLRRRGKIGHLAMCGVNGTKFPGIREHMKSAIGDVYTGLDLSFEVRWFTLLGACAVPMFGALMSVCCCQSFPADSECDPMAYKSAIASMRPGDIATIFTPDDTHFDIAMECIRHGLHVLVTKPIVKSLEEHRALFDAATERGVLVGIEVHKRFDPIYVDARDRIQVT